VRGPSLAPLAVRLFIPQPNNKVRPCCSEQFPRRLPAPIYDAVNRICIHITGRSARRLAISGRPPASP